MITIDNRTGSAELAPLFPQSLPVIISRLDFADFMFLGNGPDGSLVTVGIERKTIKDLLNSMISGRLSGHQIPGMKEAYEYPYLLVEGTSRFNPSSGILEGSTTDGLYWFEECLGQRRFMAKEVIGFLNTLSIKAGIHIIYSRDKRETVQTVCSLYHWWTAKNWEGHVSHLSASKAHKGVHGEILFQKPSLTRRWAAELGGIGWGKSLAVANHFPSPLAMAEAGIAEWKKVPGIGTVIAKDAFEAIRKEATREREKSEED